MMNDTDQFDLFAEDIDFETLGVERLPDVNAAGWGCFSCFACFGTFSSSTKGTGSSLSSNSGW